MEQVWKYYNTLPSLLEAKERFNNRERFFLAVAHLLSTYNNMFGVCLVHAHCILSEGEIMLAEGNVSQPVHVSTAPTCYAERWLSSGQPYEFTTHPTQEPPDSLVKGLRSLTGDDDALGLYFIVSGDVKEASVITLEWTEGRKNLVREMKLEDWEQRTVGTAWALDIDKPVKMAPVVYCVEYCIIDTSRTGNHTGGYFNFYLSTVL